MKPLRNNLGAVPTNIVNPNNQELVSHDNLRTLATALYQRLGNDILNVRDSTLTSANEHTNAQIERLIGESGGDTATWRTLVELFALMGEKAAEIESLEELIAALDFAYSEHTHEWADINNVQIRNEQLMENVVDGRVLDNILPYAQNSIGPSSDLTDFGNTITIPNLVFDQQGRLRGTDGDTTITLPEIPDALEFATTSHPLGALPIAGVANTVARGDHSHPMPDHNDVGAAPAVHGHLVTEVEGGTYTRTIGGVENSVTFGNLGAELFDIKEDIEDRTTYEDAVSIADTAVVNQRFHFRDDEIALYHGDRFISSIPVVSNNDVLALVAQIDSFLP